MPARHLGAAADAFRHLSVISLFIRYPISHRRISMLPAFSSSVAFYNDDIRVEVFADDDPRMINAILPSEIKISATDARTFAALLLKCADYIEGAL
jgi:hypothetical protein